MSNDIEVKIAANAADLQRGMDQAAKSVEDGAQRMDGSLKTAGDSMSGVATTVRSAFASVAAVAAAAFSFVAIKNAADETVKYTEAAMDLGRAMGVSATDASVWISVLDDIGATQGELSAASRGLTKNLTKNEDSLNAMGLATRDANGKLRPMNDLMLDAIAVVNSYKEGTDRNAAAQEVFGRSVNGSSKLLLASREAAEETERKMRDLGMVVGQDNVQAWKDYDQASDDAHLTGKALQITIGQALIPVMTAFKSSLVSIGPELVKVARVAMETFLGVIDLARMVKQAFVSVGSDIGAVAAAASMALRGDFVGAMNVFKERAADAVRETQKLKDLWNGTGDSFLGKFRQKFTASDAPAEGGNDFQAPPGASGSKGKSKKADGPIDALGSGSYITSDKGTAEMIREQQSAINALQSEMVREGERAAKAMEDAYRKSAQQQMQIDLIRAQSARDAELSRIQESEAAAQHQVNMGFMTKDALLALQEGFNAERLAAEQQFIDAKKQIALQDPDNPVELERIEAEKAAIRQRYGAQGMEIQRQQALESQTIWSSLTDSISGLWDKGMQAMMQGTLTWSNAFRAVGSEMARWFAVDVVGKKVKLWLLGETAKTGATATGTAARLVLEAGAALKSVAIHGAAAAKNIMVNAWAAMAAAWQAIVGIPYVGPVLAPIAAAATFAGVAALAKNVMSAEGGYDIPAGINPMTQLHAQEMVLPKKHANVIRDLADGKGGEGQQQAISVTMNVQTPDADSFRANADQITADLHQQLAQLQRGV